LGSTADLTVSPARPADVEAIVSIASSCLLADLTPAQASAQGFLGSRLPDDTYRTAIDGPARLLVCRDRDDRVVGFLYAFPLEGDARTQLLACAEEDIRGPVLQIRQVATHPDHRRSGVASLLYEHFFRTVAPLTVVAVIVASPPNIPSFAHHQKQGFGIAGTFTTDEGSTRVLMVRPGALQTGVADRGDLLAQYTAAIRLYLHEDQNNWTKINNFFYVTAGLLAVVGLTLPELRMGASVATGGVIATLYTLFALGAITSSIFLVALRSGVTYLNARKDATIEIETRLMSVGASPVVHPRAVVDRPTLLRRSSVQRVIPWIPLFVGAAWISAAIALTVALLLGPGTAG
jgi:GNAT superfamily N-acetyltransferase